MGVGVGVGFEAGGVAVEGAEGGVGFEEVRDVGGIVELAGFEEEVAVEVCEGGGVEVVGGDFVDAVLLAGSDGDGVGDGVGGGVESGGGGDDDVHVAFVAVGGVEGLEGLEEQGVGGDVAGVEFRGGGEGVGGDDGRAGEGEGDEVEDIAGNEGGGEDDGDVSGGRGGGWGSGGAARVAWM